MGVTLADLPERYRAQAVAQMGEGARLVSREAPAAAPKPHKYGAHKRLGPNFMGGTMLYPSIWQAEVAVQLEREMALGMWRRISPEPSLIVGQQDDGTPIRARPDFLGIRPSGCVVLIEAKGHDVAEGRAKRGVLKAQGWDVETRRKPARGRRGRG